MRKRWEEVRASIPELMRRTEVVERRVRLTAAALVVGAIVLVAAAIVLVVAAALDSRTAAAESRQHPAASPSPIFLVRSDGFDGSDRARGPNAASGARAIEGVDRAVNANLHTYR